MALLLLFTARAALLILEGAACLEAQEEQADPPKEHERLHVSERTPHDPVESHEPRHQQDNPEPSPCRPGQALIPPHEHPADDNEDQRTTHRYESTSQTAYEIAHSANHPQHGNREHRCAIEGVSHQHHLSSTTTGVSTAGYAATDQGPLRIIGIDVDLHAPAAALIERIAVDPD